jgi:hypothetical protein
LSHLRMFTPEDIERKRAREREGLKGEWNEKE